MIDAANIGDVCQRGIQGGALVVAGWLAGVAGAGSEATMFTSRATGRPDNGSTTTLKPVTEQNTTRVGHSWCTTARPHDRATARQYRFILSMN